MTKLDWVTLLIGLAGLLLITTGAWLIYRPAGFIVLGAGLLAWSYLVARSAAGHKG